MASFKLVKEFLKTSNLKKVLMHKDFFKAPIAHRGYHDCGQLFGKGRTENSLSAVEAAIDMGYAIEIDLQITQDGFPLAYHDYDLKRLVGQDMKLRETSYTDVRKFLLPNGERIPSLNEILDLVNGRVPIFFEIKTQDSGLGSKIGLLEKKVADSLKNYTGLVAIMSYNPFSVFHVGNLIPHIPRGLVTDQFSNKEWPNLSESYRLSLKKINYSTPLKVSFISHDFRDLKNSIITKQKDLDIEILCWTVRNMEVAVKSLEIASNITFEGFEAKI